MDPIDLLIKEVGEHRVKYHEPLKYYLFHQQASIARFFFIATNRREFIKILDLCNDLKIPFLVFGNGTKWLLDKPRIGKLVIRNRTSNARIVGVKGKVGQTGLGVAEAKLDIDSGLSLQGLNEYLDQQGLKPVVWSSFVAGTIGGSLLVDKELRSRVEKVTVWSKGEIEELEISEVTSKHIVISVVMSFKAKDSA